MQTMEANPQTSAAQPTDPVSVSVSPAAADAIVKAAAARDRKPTGLRVGIRGGGCTGFSYLFEWSDTEPRVQDQVIPVEGGMRVFIDPKSLVFLRGSTLDFKKTLMQRGFTWVNPNSKGSCGCGESVQF
jgi:iron-sulfur cluster assembly protein